MSTFEASDPHLSVRSNEETSEITRSSKAANNAAYASPSSRQQGSLPEKNPPKKPVQPPKKAVQPPKKAVQPPKKAVQPPKKAVQPPKRVSTSENNPKKEAPPARHRLSHEYKPEDDNPGEEDIAQTQPIDGREQAMARLEKCMGPFLSDQAAIIDVLKTQMMAIEELLEICHKSDFLPPSGSSSAQVEHPTKNPGLMTDAEFAGRMDELQDAYCIALERVHEAEAQLEEEEAQLEKEREENKELKKLVEELGEENEDLAATHSDTGK